MSSTFFLSQLTIAPPRILGIREQDCNPKDWERAKKHAIEKAKTLNKRQNNRLEELVEKLQESTEQNLWEVIMLFEEPSQWAITIHLPE